MDSKSDNGGEPKPANVSIFDAVHALDLLQIFDSQQEVPVLMEPEIAQTLRHLRNRLLRQRLIRLGESQQTTIDRYFRAVWVQPKLNLPQALGQLQASTTTWSPHSL